LLIIKYNLYLFFFNFIIYKITLNKQFIFNLGDTYDIKFSLTGFLDFDPIKNYYCKSRVLSCANGTILDITFKFLAGFNMRLIFDCFYASRKKKKQRLPEILDLMCGQNLQNTNNIETYIDFLFSFYLLIILLFLFFYFFANFVIISWNFVTLYCYVLLIQEIWRFLLDLVGFQWGT
jgi:hypothetical protein